MNNTVYVGCLTGQPIAYPGAADAFSPDTPYPEYPFQNISSSPNPVYDLIREGLYALGYDGGHYGTAAWNPLGAFIRPGQTVLLKPNMVQHENSTPKNGWECLITHPSLVRTMIDYVTIALQGSGRIIIADAPIQSCDFKALIENSGYRSVLSFYERNRITVEIRDLRNYKTMEQHGSFIRVQETAENQNRVVELGSNSLFCGLPLERYRQMRVTNYDPDIMKAHHNEAQNEYLIAQDVLSADIIINMPKPKTHRKAGVTISLKNMIGINTNKEWLPHHTNGAKRRGGDEYLHANMIKAWVAALYDKKNRADADGRLFAALSIRTLIRALRLLSKFTQRDPFTEGSWYGNDTIWRTILDLNRIVRYADAHGTLCEQPQRSVFSVADMIVSGEGEGPLHPSPKPVGMIAMAEDAVCMDEVLATLMGFDYRYIPSINNARLLDKMPVCLSTDEGKIISNRPEWNQKASAQLKPEEVFRFTPPKGWTDYKGERHS